MKKIFALFGLICFITFGHAQDSDYAGTYESRFEMSNGEMIAYTLELNDDGTFFFKSLKELNTGEANSEEYAQGAWSSDRQNHLLLTTSESDIDEVHTLNLTNTKARIINNSARNKAGKSSGFLLIYSTDIPWLKGTRLEKS